jgi:RNA polymerase sigma factor (TIGR02999 family)
MDVTTLLKAVEAKTPGAMDRLMERVYGELKVLARSKRVGFGPDALEPTTLVHEAWAKMLGEQNQSWENRKHFFWAAGQAIRNILVDWARATTAAKRGGGWRRQPLTDIEVNVPDAHQLLELDEALRKFEQRFPDEAQVISLKYFTALTWDAIAEATGRSRSAVLEEWSFARTWLKRELANDR